MVDGSSWMEETAYISMSSLLTLIASSRWSMVDGRWSWSMIVSAYITPVGGSSHSVGFDGRRQFQPSVIGLGDETHHRTPRALGVLDERHVDRATADGRWSMVDDDMVDGRPSIPDGRCSSSQPWANVVGIHLLVDGRWSMVDGRVRRQRTTRQPSTRSWYPPSRQRVAMSSRTSTASSMEETAYISMSSLLTLIASS